MTDSVMMLSTRKSLHWRLPRFAPLSEKFSSYDTDRHYPACPQKNASNISTNNNNNNDNDDYRESTFVFQRLPC